MEDEKRIDQAVEAGELAFWAEVAKVFNSCKSRDIDPIMACELHAQMKHAVKQWVRLNWREERPWVLIFGEGSAVPYDIDQMVASAILHDDSRHNDKCPRFSHQCEGVSVVLRVDHPDPAQRYSDTGQSTRFGVYVQQCDENGAYSGTPDEYIYGGDDLHTAIAAVTAAIAARDPVARHVAARIYPDLNVAVNIAAIVERGILAGCTDEQIADTLSDNSGLNGEQIGELIRLGRRGIL